MKMQPNADGERFKPYSDGLLSRMRGTAITRREAVRRALLGAGGLLLGRHLSLRALAAAAIGPSQSQVRHPNLDVGRPVAPGHL